MARTMADVQEDALNYGMGINNGFFDIGSGTAKFSRSWLHVRISMFGIVWSVISALLFYGFLFFLRVTIFGTFGPFYYIFGTLPAFVYSCLVGFLGYKLASWSPLKKSTGESMGTYLAILFRDFVSRGGLLAKLPSTREVYSLARTLDGRGVKVKAREYLGTQPLRNAPPYDPDYDPSEHGGVPYMTTYNFVPRGRFSVYENKFYHDGLSRD